MIEQSNNSGRTFGEASNDGAIRVFYDGACPLCRREIAFLRARDQAGRMSFEDISDGDGDVVADRLSCADARARMHIQMPDGEIRSGARAFLAMWSAGPGLKPLATLLSVPPLPWVLDRLYSGFLLVRPWIQAFFRRRERAQDQAAARSGSA